MLDLDLEGRIVAALRQIIRAVDLHSRHLVEVCGLTGPQLAVLQAAKRVQQASVSAIAREVHLSLPTVTGILKRLEARGLVRRTPVQTDRRKTHVSLTDAGTETLGRAPSLLQDRFRERLLGLAEWERHLMLASLQRIATLMGAESLDASPHLISDGRSIAATDESAPGSAGRGDPD